jgi:hypothetical protein
MTIRSGRLSAGCNRIAIRQRRGALDNHALTRYGRDAFRPVYRLPPRRTRILCAVPGKLDDSSLMIHQLGNNRQGHGGRHITDCPEGHNPAVFIARTEKNISPTPERQ